MENPSHIQEQTGPESMSTETRTRIGRSHSYWELKQPLRNTLPAELRNHGCISKITACFSPTLSSTLRKKNQSLALATMDKEDFEEPYYIVAWKNADHPNVPAGPETTLITWELFSSDHIINRDIVVIRL